MLVLEAEARRPRAADVDLRTDLVTTTHQFDDLRAQWNALAGSIPFRRWEWSQAWWKHCRPKRSELAILAIYDADHQLVGLAPCFSTYTIGRGRVLCFLGSGQACSDYMTMLASPAFEDSVVQAVAEWVNENARAWDAIELDGVQVGDRQVYHLANCLRQRGFWSQSTPLESCWSIDLTAGWDAYLNRLSKATRKRMRRLLRHSIESGSVTVRRAETRDDVARGLAVLRDFHQRQHAIGGQRAAFAGGHMTSFLEDIADRFFETGDLLLSWIESDGKPIAATFDLAGDKTAYSYQWAYAPDAAHLSPGWLSLVATSRVLANEGFTTYDLLRGDEHYKQSWGATPQPMTKMRITAPRAVSRVRHMMAVAEQRGRAWLKHNLKRAIVS